MSVSLVKKSLELITSEDQSTESESNSHKKSRKTIKKRKTFDGKKNATSVVKKIREQTKQTINQDKVQTNVEKLLNLSQVGVIHRKLEKKLLNKLASKEECPESNQQSAFTEEDFNKFEREYFVNGWY